MTEFTLPDHHDFVLRHAETLHWSRSRKCACSSRPDPGRANANCLACLGAGFLYDAPVTIQGMVTGIQAQRVLLETGAADLGDLLLSMSPFEPEQVRDWDKFEIVGWADGELYSGEVLVRGSGETDRLAYVPVTIDRVFSVNPVSGVVTLYLEGVNFTASGRTLTWQTGVPRPAYAQTYTVDYSPRYEWIAFNPTTHRYEQAENLGQRVVLKRRHKVMP